VDERKRTGFMNLDAFFSMPGACFDKNSHLSKTLCIDESILSFKGRLAFKLSCPPSQKKKQHCGIKLFVLRDVGSSYILDFIVYCGNLTDITDTFNLGW
jgi:hypothetical protein